VALQAQFSGLRTCPIHVLWDKKLAKIARRGYEVGYPSVDFIANQSRALKPGGWIELIEIHAVPQSYDNTMPEPCQLQEFYNVLKPLGAKMGLDIDVPTKFKRLLEDAGYDSVTEEIFDLPMGDWPQDRRMKEVGRYQRFQLIQGLGGIATALLTRFGGWSKPQIEVFLAGVRREANDRNVHILYKL